MIKIDENDPIGEVDPSFPYRDVTIKKNTDVKEFYNLQQEIGRGKFGTVYRCIEKSTGLELAAKFISIAKRADRRNAEREVEIMRELQHPRLIQMYDAYEINNSMCVVLELIEGGELFERVIDDDFVLTEKSVSVFMKQICEGVAFIHSKNIIHLDMKPENILCLTRNGNRIKVIDFGLARKYDPDKKLQVLFGTPEFVAPEVVNFDSINFGTDMWSVGVICYVLLSGLSPFMGETDVQTMSNVTIAQYDFDDESFDDISSDAKDFISKLLVKDKEVRMTAIECLSHRWLRQEKSIIVENDVPNTIIKNELDYQKDSLRYIVDRWNDDTKITPVVEDTQQPLSANADKFSILITNGNVTKNEEKSKSPETNQVTLENNKTLHQNSIHSAPSLSSFKKMDTQDINHVIQEQSSSKIEETSFKMVNGNQSEVGKVSTQLHAARAEASICNISCKHKDSRKESTPNGLMTMDSSSVTSNKNSKNHEIARPLPNILELSAKNIPEVNNDSNVIATLVNTSRTNITKPLPDTGKPSQKLFLRVKAKVMSDENNIIAEIDNSVKTNSENRYESTPQVVSQSNSDIIAEVNSTSKINNFVPLSTKVEPKIINDKSDVSVQVGKTAKTKEIKPVPTSADTVKSSTEVLIQVSSDTSDLVLEYDATSKITESILSHPKVMPRILTEKSDIITEGIKVNKSASTSTSIETAKPYPKTSYKLLPHSKNAETECIDFPTSLVTPELSPEVRPKLIHSREKIQPTPDETIANLSLRVLPNLTIDATKVTTTVDSAKTAKTELASITPDRSKSPPNVFSMVSDNTTDVNIHLNNTRPKETQSIPPSAKQRNVNSVTTKKNAKSKSTSSKINSAEVISDPKSDLFTKSTRSSNLVQSTEQVTRSSRQNLAATCTLSNDKEINVKFEIEGSDLKVKQSSPISETKSSHPETKKVTATIEIDDGPCERVKKRSLVMKSIVENQQTIPKEEEKHFGNVAYLLEDDYDEENPSDNSNVAQRRRISDITSSLSRTELVNRCVEEEMAALYENLHKIVRLRQNSFSKPSSAASSSSESCSSKRPKYRVSYFSRDVPFSNAAASCHAANLLSYFSLDSDEDGIISANERLPQTEHQSFRAWKRMFQFEGGRKCSLHSDPGSLRESPEKFTSPSMTRKLFSKFFGDSMEYDLVTSPTHPLKRAKDKITEVIS